MVQAREDGSFIFYVSDMFVEALLRVSGHGGVFIKCHADEGRPLMELLWLDAGVSLDKALEYLKDTRVMGLTESGESGRVAIFFATQGAMDELRKAYIMGLLMLILWEDAKLQGFQWVPGWRAYSAFWCLSNGMCRRSCSMMTIFMSENRGQDSPAHYMFHVCEDCDSRPSIRALSVRLRHPRTPEQSCVLWRRVGQSISGMNSAGCGEVGRCCGNPEGRTDRYPAFRTLSALPTRTTIFNF